MRQPPTAPPRTLAALLAADTAEIERLLAVVATLDDGWADPRLARLRAGLQALAERRSALVAAAAAEAPAPAPERPAAARTIGPHPAPRDLAGLRELRVRLRQELMAAERQIVEAAIAAASGNLTRAAEQLGLHRVTLHKLMRGWNEEKSTGEEL